MLPPARGDYTGNMLLHGDYFAGGLQPPPHPHPLKENRLKGYWSTLDQFLFPFTEKQ
jgi:hypothetical protein